MIVSICGPSTVIPGDYLYGDHREPFREAGLWGIFRVYAPTPRDGSRRLPPIAEPSDIQGEHYTVRVVVTDTQGAPIEGVRVTLQPANRTRVSDDHGSAIFAGVEPGHYQVLIAHDGYRGEQSIAVEGSERVIELQIQIEKQDALSLPLALWGVGVVAVLLLGGAGLWWIRR